MSFELYYPFGKKKAMTFSYDDGQIHDRRLVGIFNKYRMKATFHLNSGTIGTEGFISREELPSLYEGHEVSCHGVSHPHLTHLSKEEIVYEIWEDRRYFESLVKYPVRGMSYPFGEYDDIVVKSLEVLGITYSRTVNTTDCFLLPGNFLEWNPTCHHNDNIMSKLNSFKNQPHWAALSLFYIYGHSFEFPMQNNWELIEEFCEKAAYDPDVWYATNIEIKDYICAMRQLIFNVDQTLVYNPTCIPVWIGAGQRIIEVKSGLTVILDQLS
ncbi:polysaccharide deacetylase [Ruminiclostridium sufflavum DSM 19573]|uniref:Polysaccharide deacetylase n=1 Tax=Ruminiclostridium sufflavum DSM 19573 TaxID=1121337 RepID=A0A318XPU7_9FIRM|nr:polysaccharide deacetylase family protein [Ruminiclostridium sufflavum]PYG89178.1 polysaccharide deacetylase [Ruminiclostridium sufflavum DSM 19573]